MVRVSYNLGLLRKAGIVAYAQDWRARRYRLNGGKVRKGMLELTHPSGLKVSIPLEAARG